MKPHEKELLAKIRAYQERYDINVVCQSSGHREDQLVASFTRVGGLTKAGGEIPLRDHFEPAGAGIQTTGQHRRQHDAGQYSTSLTHDGDTPLSDYDARRQRSRGHHELECRQCGHKVPVRDEHLQPILEQMDGKATVLTLDMLETLLHNRSFD